MARQASSKLDSGSSSTATIGFWTNPTSFGIRHSGFVITPAGRLAIMNLAIRGIEADNGKEHADTFRRDLPPALRADYVLANPPFNDSAFAWCSTHTHGCDSVQSGRESRSCFVTYAAKTSK